MHSVDDGNSPENQFSDAIRETAVGATQSIVRPWKYFSFKLYRSLCGSLGAYSDFGVWQHYVMCGRHTVPFIHVEEEKFAETFPAREYIEAYSDLNGYSKHDAYIHFTRHGIGEGRRVHALSDGWIEGVLRIINAVPPMSPQ
jgi:hypothetical protein